MAKHLTVQNAIIAILGALLGWQLGGESTTIEQRGEFTVTHRKTGDVQGLWSAGPKFETSVIIHDKRCKPPFEDAVPYVQLFLVKDGKRQTFPYGLNMQGGELQLQMPQGDTATIIPMEMVERLIKEDAERRKAERDRKARQRAWVEHVGEEI